MIWRTAYLDGEAIAWPDEVKPLFLLRSDDPEAREFEAVHGKIFDRYPGLFRLTTKARGDEARFSFHMIPLRLKAMAEGSLRRRMASAILRRALEALRAKGYEDIIVGGNINAPLASEDFAKLVEAGYVAMGAADEAEGAFTYLKRPKSLIDNIFLSPNLARTFGADEFLIVARDREIGDFVQTISDHRPIMIRLSLADIDQLQRPAFDLELVLDHVLSGAAASSRTPSEALTDGGEPGKIPYEELK